MIKMMFLKVLVNKTGIEIKYIFLNLAKCLNFNQLFIEAAMILVDINRTVVLNIHRSDYGCIIVGISKNFTFKSTKLFWMLTLTCPMSIWWQTRILKPNTVISIWIIHHLCATWVLWSKSIAFTAYIFYLFYLCIYLFLAIVAFDCWFNQFCFLVFVVVVACSSFLTICSSFSCFFFFFWFIVSY